ncbi:MAG: hypothetical protein ACRDP6_23950 [Actinoallomurus sp.]
MQRLLDVVFIFAAIAAVAIGIILFRASIIFVPWLIAAVIISVLSFLDWRTRAVLALEDISFYRLNHYLQWKPARISWSDITSIEVEKVARQLYPKLYLADGQVILMRCPSSAYGRAHLSNSIETIRRYHRAARN